MASASLYLGLDVGTQGVKAVVYDGSSRQVVGRGAQPWSIIESNVPGRAEQHPKTWLEGTVKAAKQALSQVDASRVCALGVSGQQHGMVVLDKQDKVLRPAKVGISHHPAKQDQGVVVASAQVHGHTPGEVTYYSCTAEWNQPPPRRTGALQMIVFSLWCDTESAPEAAELSQTLGYTVVPSFTITKLLWLKRHEPEVWSQVAAVMLPHDYVNFWLTGRKVTEAGDASGTGLLDVSARVWDPKLAALVDPQLSQWLPTLIGPNEAVGEVSPAVAAQLGLPAGVLVSPGSGDNAMSALGAGITQPGQIVVSLGTSATLFGVAGMPVIEPTCSVCPFCDATGAWLPLICTLNCTVPAEEVCEAFGMSHADITLLAEAVAPGAEGVNFLPYLLGERTPNWPHSSGAVLGLRQGLLRPGVLYRAALEGATYSLAAALDTAVTLGLELKELRLVGGGSKNKLWQQIVSDVFQLPVRLPLETESAALGAALQAAAVHSKVPVGQYVQQNQPPVSEQVVQPNPANKQVYAAALARHMDLGQQLFASQQTKA